jgi:ribose-phosphate pyrophosphokinase
MDSLTAVPTLCQTLQQRLPADVVVVSPDVGRVQMATEYAHRLGTSVVVLHKRRESGTRTGVTHVVVSTHVHPDAVLSAIAGSRYGPCA